jgi:2-polyprenyl-3-methyl-5-hydroxy-6-metoxy-1,4-benzoquinol methylase
MSLKPEPLIKSVDLTQITPDQLAEIRSVPHFRNSHYREWNLNNLLLSYVEAYVRPLAALKPVNPGSVISDVGTGYGWLAFAFAMVTPGRVVALDFDAKQVDTRRVGSGMSWASTTNQWRNLLPNLAVIWRRRLVTGQPA